MSIHNHSITLHFTRCVQTRSTTCIKMIIFLENANSFFCSINCRTTILFQKISNLRFENKRNVFPCVKITCQKSRFTFHPIFPSFKHVDPPLRTFSTRWNFACKATFSVRLKKLNCFQLYCCAILAEDDVLRAKFRLVENRLYITCQLIKKL